MHDGVPDVGAAFAFGQPLDQVAPEFRLELLEQVDLRAFAKLVGAFLLKLTLQVGRLGDEPLGFPKMLRLLGVQCIDLLVFQRDDASATTRARRLRGSKLDADRGSNLEAD
jgi:hypothetical protein